MMTLTFDQFRDLFFVAIAGHVFAAIGFVRWSIAKRKNEKPIHSLPLNHTQIYRELLYSIVIPFHALIIYVFWRFEWIQFGENVFKNQLLTSIIGLLWLELWFYLSHRLFHTKYLYRFHQIHHYSVRNTPLSGLSFSLVEKIIFSTGYLFGIALFSFMTPISLNTLCCVYLAYLAVNALGHSNYEFFNSKYPHSVLGKVFSTASYHSLHHRQPSKNFGLMTRLCDRLFKTESVDYLIENNEDNDRYIQDDAGCSKLAS